MFGKKKTALPAFLRDEKGRLPVAASPIEPLEEGQWIAGWSGYLEVMSESGSREKYEWSEFETGNWEDEKNALTLNFIDPRLDPLVFILPREADPLIITMVRERIDRSVVYQAFADLPSGGIARGQLRRRADESLFVQIIVDNEPTSADEAVLRDLENELRESVGLYD